MKPRVPWRKVAVYGGGVLVIVGVTAVVTLAVTHNSAVHQNFAAYTNGLIDGWDAAAIELVAQ